MMFGMMIFCIEFIYSFLATLELLSINAHREKLAVLFTGLREGLAVFLIYSIATRGLYVAPFAVAGNVLATLVGMRFWKNKLKKL